MPWFGTKGCKYKNLKSPQWLRNIKDKIYPFWRLDVIFSDKKYSNIKLIDKYDVYQHLMKYWFEVMQDDVYQISGEGWEEAAQLRLIIDKKNKGKKVKEMPDIVVGSGKKSQKFKADLIPPNLIVQRYFSEEKCVIDELEAQREAIIQEIDELTEEHSGEEGLLEDAKNEKGKLTKISLKNRIKEFKNNEGLEDEMVIIKQAQKLLEQESALASKIKFQQLELDKKTLFRYSKLNVNEIKELVVIDKWFARISADVNAEIERVTQILSTRVIELEERYANPMPELIEQVSDYSYRVEKHLKKMGLSW